MPNNHQYVGCGYYGNPNGHTIESLERHQWMQRVNQKLNLLTEAISGAAESINNLIESAHKAGNVLRELNQKNPAIDE